MRVLLLIIAFWQCFAIPAKSQTLSDEAEISLLTCAAGEELYSLFGHSALRVQDSSQNIDRVFNYGTFDFNAPNFYVKFAQGKLDYLLSMAEYQSFIRSYQYEKRSVYSQKLLLSQMDKQRLFDALLYNYQPENSAYKYDFFMDNCATRIDEIIKNTLGGEWQDNTDWDKLGETYRTGIVPFLANSDWLNLGLNIILGIPTDNLREGLFLPEIMQNHFANTTYNGKPIVGEVQTLYDANYTYKKTPFLLSPLFVFGLLVLFLLIGGMFFPNSLRIVDFLLFATVGIAGCIMAFLWFGADHTATNENWNLLWALPTHLPMAFALLRKKKSKFTHYYFLFSFVVLCILLVFMVLPQFFALFNYIPMAFPFHLIIPIVLCLIFRSLGIVLKKQ